ncbi:flavin-containing monooxygenase [Microbacterium suwonense]|uniref:flavin-containing monooxygenase n=1 Tax=Microbacterium suwonense TaxID=683047 RepID=UPI0025728701|nr:NAD(P)/FAD-dependent oxidoreductase [Microbacterium suwonense]
MRFSQSVVVARVLPQPEIYEYLRRTAKDEGLLPHVVFHAEILDARWDGELERWVVTTTAGTWRARVFVAATGHLADPKAPQITGIDQFAGDLFHSAAWDHEATLHGKRIGVIGTGASGIQVIPQMAAIAKSVTVFQRSAPYIIPREERAYADHEREAFRKFPGLMEEVRRDLFWTNEETTPRAGWFRRRSRRRERSRSTSLPRRSKTKSCGRSSPPTTIRAASAS